MEIWLIICNVLFIFVVLAIFLKQNRGGNRVQHEIELAKLTEQLANEEKRVIELQRERDKLDKERLEYIRENGELLSQLNAQKESAKDIEERLKAHFEAISTKIIEENREKVNSFNATQMEGIFKGFRDNLDNLKKDMHDANHRQTTERSDLKAQIELMVKVSQGMNEEAKKLSNALRNDNKSAGDWGETILETILDNSGLVKGESGYELQKVLGDNKLRPDAIVHLPDGRKVIIDSKVSIKDYVDYCNAEDKEERRRYLDNHIRSIKNHSKGLAPKEYERYLEGSVDFVMMFIPNDYAAMAALQQDPSLWRDAYDKKVLIISPTNLITSLKIVKDLWAREARYKDVDNILIRAQALKEKCETFLVNYEIVGKKIIDTQNAYDKALTQLKGDGNIIRQVELLEKAGFQSKKAQKKKTHNLKSYEAEEISEELE